MSTSYIITATKTGEPFGTRSSKSGAIKVAEATGYHCTITTNTGTVVWTSPEPAPEAAKPKKVYKKAIRATVQPESAITGKFELATYGKDGGETAYSKRPDATLRAILGIKWVELWELGISQKRATAILKALDAGETTVDEILEPLGFEVEA